MDLPEYEKGAVGGRGGFSGSEGLRNKGGYVVGVNSGGLGDDEGRVC